MPRPPIRPRFWHVPAALLILLFTTCPQAADLPALAAIQAQGHQVAGMVVDLETGRTVAAIAPEQHLIPASVTKIYTTALALETWGPDHRFETRVLRRGARSGNRLEGDLIFRGGGDPALTNESLWRLALDVAATGLTEVSGDVVVDESLFGRLACDNADRCKAERRSWHSYDAPLSAAAINHSNLAVVVTPGASAGAPAQVRFDPYPLLTFGLRGTVQTVPGRGAQVEVGRITQDGRDWVEVGGSIGADAPPLRVYRSVGNAPRYAGELLRAFLTAAGVTVMGGVQVRQEPVPGEPLATLTGQPLGNTLNTMMYFSNNFIADLLAVNLLVARQANTPVSMAAAGGVLEAYARELTVMSGLSDRPSQARLLDGSGLNPDNRLAPVDLVALLAHIYRRSEDFPGLVGSLRVPAHSPARGLAGKDDIWKRLAVKTGGLSEPVSVVTLAGYLRFEDGGWGAFALLVNGRPGKWVPRVEAFAAMRSDLERLQRAPRN